MSLVVEDGTGLTDADSYGSAAAFETWCERRNRDLTSYNDDQIEGALRGGFLYINTKNRYKAITLTSAQSGEFPREGLVDWNGRSVMGVPQRVIWSNFELAWAQLVSGQDLYQDLDRGGKVTSESVGPISVAYAFDAPAGKVFFAAMKLLEPYVRDVGQAYAPFIGGAAGQTDTDDQPTELGRIFDVGMHTNDSN